MARNTLPGSNSVNGSTVKFDLEETSTEIVEDGISCNITTGNFEESVSSINYCKTNGVNNMIQNSVDAYGIRIITEHSTDVERGKNTTNAAQTYNLLQTHNTKNNNIESSGLKLSVDNYKRDTPSKISYSTEVCDSNMAPEVISTGSSIYRSLTSETNLASFNVPASSVAAEVVANNHTAGSVSRFPQPIALPAVPVGVDTNKAPVDPVEVCSPTTVSTAMSGRPQRSVGGASKMTKSVECWGSGKPFASLCQSSLAKNITLTVSIVHRCASGVTSLTSHLL